MKIELRWSLILCLLLCFYSAAQPAPDKVADVAPPASDEQAREVFLKAWNLEKEQKHGNALAHYRAVLEYYQKNKQNNYRIITLTNMGGIYAGIGKHLKAIEILKQALELADRDENLKKAAELHHKIGVILNHLAEVEEYKKQNPNIIYPEIDKNKDTSHVDINSGTYTQLVQIGKQFKAKYIHMGDSENPYEKPRRLYTKIINLKVKGDFEPKDLLTPDSVELLIQVRKKGYFPVGKTKSLLPEIEYAELDETMVAIPRQVKPKVTEDFYRTGIVTPDEITLRLLTGNKMGKPTVITDKEAFKPGHYQFNVKKSGYVPINKGITIYPGEGPYSLPIELKSKLRNVAYRIQSDYMPADQSELVPDEISLNGQPVHKESKVKPGEYKLVIKKEGYEPIIKNVTIVPDERQYMISEFIRALPREVLFHITGDYAPGEDLAPDEVTLDGRFVRSGDTVRPDSYRVVVRKKGYDVASEHILIEPKNEPYIVKKSLVSTPRRIDLNIMANFPKGKKLFPETATLNRKNIAKEESFKPGEYELIVKQGGYESITKNINIAPDDIPYRIEETLQAKPRAINIEITRDIAPENPRLPTRISLVNERTSESVTVKSGDEILPESYLLKIQQDGYEPDISKHVIFPSEEGYNARRRLVASMRTVLTKITAEYPPKQIIVPDEITLDNKPVGKDFKIKPGAHDLVILCEGYLPIREPVKILASPKEYRLIRQLETRSRLVNFIFLDSYNGVSLDPDEVMLGDEKIMPGVAQNLKPGKYSLSVRLSGYSSIDEEIEIPVGVTPYKIQRFLVAIKREVLPNITSDYSQDRLKLDEVDIFTLSDLPIEGMKDSKTGKIYVKPGKFTLFIQKKGYREITEDINITPAPDAYEINKQLVSKLRQLDITIKSSYPFADKNGITPDAMKLGVKDIQNGDKIKPGEYALMIKKRGYRDVNEQITINPSENAYELKRTLEALPRMVKYKITNDFDGRQVEPDLITIDDQNINQESMFTPGKYTVKIEKLGYYPKVMDITIEPNDDPFLIETVLVSMTREIELNITGDFPPDEIIDPEIAALNGTDVRDDVFKPGKYVLEIQQPGFESLKEDVVIDPGEDVYIIDRVLVSTPRMVKEDISFDVPPPEELGAHKITMAPAENPSKETVITDGTMLKPGEYIMRITKEAYEPIEKRKYVWPAAEEMVISEELVAKQVLLLINITYDVKPPEGLSNYSVSLIDRTGIPRYVKHGNRTKPGQYKLKVERPGYSFGAPKQIYILPSEQPYHMSEHLLAKPRPLSFDMVDTSIPDRPKMVSAYKIINTGTDNEVTFRDSFQPGKNVDLIVMFEKYKTVHKGFMIIPGEGPFVINVTLAKLEKFEFSVRHKDKKKPPFIELDGIEYPYEFFVDFEPLEAHHIKNEPGVGKWYYTIMAEKSAQNLQAFGGYMYVQKRIARPGTLPRFNAISVPRLIEHLDKIAKMPGRGYRGSLEVMENGMRSPRWRRMLQKANPKEIEKLIHFLEDWKVDDALRLRIRVVLDELDKMRSQ